jgi:hypothetical protein
MLALRKALESIEKDLQRMTQKIENMYGLLNNLEHALHTEEIKVRKPSTKRAARKPAAKKAPKRPTRETATDAVLNVIATSRKGVTTGQIKEKTGFDERKIWGIVNRAKKQGKIKSEKKGVYVRT